MKSKILSVVLILLVISFAYITNITLIPENITLLENENYEIGLLKGIDIDGENICTKETLFQQIAKVGSNLIGEAKFKISTLGGFASKNITVSVIPNRMVIPSGDIIGIQVHSKGVLVVGKSEVDGKDGKAYKPYENSNIEVGDIITHINNIKVENAKEISKIVNENEKVKITYERENKIYEDEIETIKSNEDNKYKMGLWVKDGTVGIGTLTFYDENREKYAALGHGISDIDIKKLLDVEKGYIDGANVTSIFKGRKSFPGEIRGSIDYSDDIGNIVLNTQYGVYGNILNKNNETILRGKPIPVASRNEIHTGKAIVICTIDDNGPKEYEVEIQNINNLSSNSTKSMIIKITDEELLAISGGILQGMSGSPLVQDGKFIGAVTHVFVNDPTRGYAVFGDLMLKQLLEVN